MINRRIVGFVEGFLATTGTDRYGRSFDVDDIISLRDDVESRPWLFMGAETGETPAGRVTRVEVREIGTIIGLWGRVEFYQASALKITSEGILNFFGFTTPNLPLERRTPEDFARYEALRPVEIPPDANDSRSEEERLASYMTPPALSPTPAQMAGLDSPQQASTDVDQRDVESAPLVEPARVARERQPSASDEKPLAADGSEQLSLDL